MPKPTDKGQDRTTASDLLSRPQNLPLVLQSWKAIPRRLLRGDICRLRPLATERGDEAQRVSALRTQRNYEACAANVSDADLRASS